MIMRIICIIQASNGNSDPVSDYQRPGDENAGLRMRVFTGQESGVRGRDGVRRSSHPMRYYRHLLRCRLLRDTPSHQDSTSKTTYTSLQNIVFTSSRRYSGLKTQP